ncbi:uncharacterized protein LOC107607158 [Arachis ipaensis]|uniref:uncharacterized protein LOC107607158 n=1 Tax=Arachis ipaensis TaxID=130454 RepID=UPI0007AFB403|nr:uncharacterized protein LOC107607158 [Arachis ipaensis]XP_025664752.1 uncharacterized protein LOC112763245 [Arachis hypogaea]
MEDKSLKHAYGMVENVLVKVEDLYLPTGFVILDTGEDKNNSIILGRPFLATKNALIDVGRGELILRLGEDHILFKISNSQSLSTKGGGGLKKTVPKGWKNKKIPTEDFSPGMRVVFTRNPVIQHTVNRILSLEYVELIHESTGRKFTMRGEDLSPYEPP